MRQLTYKYLSAPPPPPPAKYILRGTLAQVLKTGGKKRLNTPAQSDMQNIQVPQQKGRRVYRRRFPPQFLFSGNYLCSRACARLRCELCLGGTGKVTSSFGQRGRQQGYDICSVTVCPAHSGSSSLNILVFCPSLNASLSHPLLLFHDQALFPFSPTFLPLPLSFSLRHPITSTLPPSPPHTPTLSPFIPEALVLL